MKKLFLAGQMVCFLLFALPGFANDSTGVHFSYDKKRINKNEVLLTIKAAITQGAKLYSLQKSEKDVLYSTVSFDTAAKAYLTGKIQEKGNLKSENDEAVDAKVQFVTDSFSKI